MGAEWVLLLHGPTGTEVGSILQISRTLEDGVEVPFALVEIAGRTDAGLYQAVPLWLVPLHLNELKKSGYAVSSLLVDRHASKDFMMRAIGEMEDS